jgi:hypothetical protein
VGADDTRDVLTVDHVVFATGYKIDVKRLGFLSPELVAHIRLTGTALALSNNYEASVTGLHFIGPAAAASFGPVCRFVHGARHPARHLTKYLSVALGRRASMAGSLNRVCCNDTSRRSAY